MFVTYHAYVIHMYMHACTHQKLQIIGWLLEEIESKNVKCLWSIHDTWLMHASFDYDIVTVWHLDNKMDGYLISQTKSIATICIITFNDKYALARSHLKT